MTATLGPGTSIGVIATPVLKQHNSWPLQCAERSATHMHAAANMVHISIYYTYFGVLIMSYVAH